MAFCTNCGKELTENSKFCAECGKAVNNANQSEQRKTVYEGEIHKCPNCGDIIDAYESVCEACGYEIRDRKASNSIRELAAQIQEIEKTRDKVKYNPLKTLYFGQSMTETDKKIISLISNFPIPNTKEDLLEFIILSSSNVNASAYNTGGNQFRENDARIAVSDAWKAKLEQSYQKARLVFADDPRLNEIQTMYDNTNKSVKKARLGYWKTLGTVGIVCGIVILLSVIMSFALSGNKEDAEIKEIARMESIVQEINDALEEEDYLLALSNASRLVYDDGYGNTKNKEEWKIKRDYWIDKVIEEAAENGVTLERPAEETNNYDTLVTTKDNVLDDNESTDSLPPKSKEQLNDNSSQSEFEIELSIDEFVKGYEKAEFSKFNSPASENGLGDSKIYFYGVIEKIEVLESGPIIGYLIDESNNSWIATLHATPIVSETYFNSYIEKSIIVRGVYTGFSGTKQMPALSLDEFIVLDTGEIVFGIQKLLD